MLGTEGLKGRIEPDQGESEIFDDWNSGFNDVLWYSASCYRLAGCSRGAPEVRRNTVLGYLSRYPPATFGTWAILRELYPQILF